MNLKKGEKLCSMMLGGRTLEYILKRSGRKSVGISIDRWGLVKVSGPYSASENYIRQVLLKKASWILQKLNQMETADFSEKRPKNMVQGEIFRFMGKEYKLKLERTPGARKTTVTLDEDNIILVCKSDFDGQKLRNSLKLWYVEQFRQALESCIPRYAAVLGVQPGKITIKEQKTRWGSCSSKGNINLNWKLIMADSEILDYVVVHELCHLKEMNHSVKFWRLVESVFPDYKEYRKWLKQNGKFLTID